MEETIQSLNTLGVYTFAAMGVADYVAVKRNGRVVATIRVTEAGIIGLGGEKLSDVLAFLKENGQKVI